MSQVSLRMWGDVASRRLRTEKTNSLDSSNEGRWVGSMSLGPDNVKKRSPRGKWACVYSAETLRGFGYAKVDVGLQRGVGRLSSAE